MGVHAAGQVIFRSLAVFNPGNSSFINQASKTGLTYFQVCALALIFGANASALPQERKAAASDTPSFIAAEHKVRQELVQRYPLLPQIKASLGPGYSKNRAVADSMKYIDRLPDDQKFFAVFGYVMQGKLEVKQKTGTPPSYWRFTLANLMTSLPHGDALAATYLAESQRQAEKENSEAPNRLALANMQNFRKLVTGYEIATGDEFDRANLMAKTRFILKMFNKVQENVSLPCPYSVYLLDLEAMTDNDNETQMVPREIVGRLLGRKSPEYLQFAEYSRERKSVALKDAYLHLLGHAQDVANEPSAANLGQYLKIVSLQLSAATNTWYVEDELGKPYSFSDLMRITFGDDELEKFNRKADVPEKTLDRVAVILLWSQFHFGSASWMIG